MILDLPSPRWSIVVIWGDPPPSQNCNIDSFDSRKQFMVGFLWPKAPRVFLPTPFITNQPPTATVIMLYSHPTHFTKVSM